MAIDIFNPQVSVVAKGLEGKVITIYGSNNLGKTKQSTRMKKPLYLPFEKGLNAIAGV
ncbi:AAA family ATPase, partial [Xanthomonas citri pv. citri]|nr:AAA family ATPase [Xanthomonas citri pv. citri]